MPLPSDKGGRGGNRNKSVVSVSHDQIPNVAGPPIRVHFVASIPSGDNGLERGVGIRRHVYPSLEGSGVTGMKETKVNESAIGSIKQRAGTAQESRGGWLSQGDTAGINTGVRGGGPGVCRRLARNGFFETPIMDRVVGEFDGAV